MKRINVIAVDYSAGLNRSTRLITDTLRNAGFLVEVIRRTVDGPPQLNFQHKLHRVASCSLWRRHPYDVNLFIEDVVPEWFPYAQVNCLVPNQEWFEDRWRPCLAQLDYILCKTKFAQGIFDQLGCKTEFISFTSVDRFDERQVKNYDAFFHLAGRSLQKGTNTLLDLWLRHPEWPRLKVIQHPENMQPVAAENIEYTAKQLDDTMLRQYQNSHGIHLCPSEAEGFGHYIGEALSCKAVTVTTDAPPMNELVTPERGILAEYHKTEVQRLGINYYVNPSALEQKVCEVVGMDYTSKKCLGENARAWYEENDRFFRRRLVEVVGNM